MSWPTRNRLVIRRHEPNGWAVVELRRDKSDRVVAVHDTKRAADALVARLRRQGYGYA